MAADTGAIAAGVISISFEVIVSDPVMFEVPAVTIVLEGKLVADGFEQDTGGCRGMGADECQVGEIGIRCRLRFYVSAALRAGVAFHAQVGGTQIRIGIRVVRIRLNGIGRSHCPRADIRMAADTGENFLGLVGCCPPRTGYFCRGIGDETGGGVTLNAAGKSFEVVGNPARAFRVTVAGSRPVGSLLQQSGIMCRIRSPVRSYVAVGTLGGRSYVRCPIVGINARSIAVKVPGSQVKRHGCGRIVNIRGMTGNTDVCELCFSIIVQVVGSMMACKTEVFTRIGAGCVGKSCLIN